MACGAHDAGSPTGIDFLCIYIEEAIGPFDGTRGTMHGEDLTVVE